MKLQDFDFRIWDYKRKTFINYQCQMSFVFNNERNKENYLKVMDCFDNKNPKNNEFYGLKSYNSNDIEIELWTGYFDKNGNKIYENDIIKNESLEEIYYITRDNTYKMFEIIIYDKDCNENLYRKKILLISIC
ncbi:YopX family protein [Campylobacter jejuni]